MQQRIRWRMGAALAACAVAVVGLPGQALGAAPPFVRTIGGPAVAEMYPSGLEHDAARSRIVIADTGMNKVKIYPDNGDPATEFGRLGTGNGEFDAPRDIAIDPQSNIYVADAENNRVQKFDPIGGWQWTRSGLGHPMGVTYDEANDKLLVAATGANTVAQLAPETGAIQWRSPKGDRIGFKQVRDVARGPDGRVWVTDYGNAQIDVFNVSPTGGWPSAPAFSLGSRGTGDGLLAFPYNVDFNPTGRIAYVSDTGGAEIDRWDISVTPPKVLPALGFGHCPGHPAEPCPDPPADKGFFDNLRRVAVRPDGKIVAADFWGNGLQIFPSNPKNLPGGITQIAGQAAPKPGFAQAYGVAVAGDGSTYVMDRLNQQIDKYDAADDYVNSAGDRGVAEGTFSWPEGVAVAPDGMVWVADTRNDQLMRWNPDLTDPTSVPGGASKGSGLGQFNVPKGVDVDPLGEVWVADTWNDRVQAYNPTTDTFRAFGSAGTADGKFDRPQGIAANRNYIYVADTENNRIQKFAKNGAFIKKSGALGLKHPEGIAVAGDGTVWVADSLNNRVLHLSADLVELGDGFGGTTDQLNRPHSLTVMNNQLFVADTHNHRIQVYGPLR